MVGGDPGWTVPIWCVLSDQSDRTVMYGGVLVILIRKAHYIVTGNTQYNNITHLSSLKHRRPVLPTPPSPVHSKNAYLYLRTFARRPYIHEDII